jgi:hypothetical protein
MILRNEVIGLAGFGELSFLAIRRRFPRIWAVYDSDRMVASGHSRQFRDVRDRSASPPTADVMLSAANDAMCQQAPSPCGPKGVMMRTLIET